MIGSLLLLIYYCFISEFISTSDTNAAQQNELEQIECSLSKQGQELYTHVNELQEQFILDTQKQNIYEDNIMKTEEIQTKAQKPTFIQSINLKDETKMVPVEVEPRNIIKRNTG